MSGLGYQVHFADNFSLLGRGPMPYEGNDPNGWLSCPGLVMDMRTDTLSRCTIIDASYTWYLNYLDMCRYFAEKHPTCYAMFLLDAGFVPVVYVPIDTDNITNDLSRCMAYQSVLQQKLILSGLPYTAMNPTSFTDKRLSYSHITDAWVSKMDAAKFLGCNPEDVTSERILKEVLKI